MAKPTGSQVKATPTWRHSNTEGSDLDGMAAKAAQKTKSTKTGIEIIADLDDLLDEIDEVLETNAEDFVNSYIQKGGQ